MATRSNLTQAPRDTTSQNGREVGAVSGDVRHREALQRLACFGTHPIPVLEIRRRTPVSGSAIGVTYSRQRP